MWAGSEGERGGQVVREGGREGGRKGRERGREGGRKGGKGVSRRKDKEGKESR